MLLEYLLRILFYLLIAILILAFIFLVLPFVDILLDKVYKYYHKYNLFCKGLIEKIQRKKLPL